MKEHLHKSTYGYYEIGSLSDLEAETVSALISEFENPAYGGGRGLEGRAPVRYVALPQLGEVAIKRYHRGGILGKIISNLYLRIGKTRAEVEFERFFEANQIGINAPEPLVFAYTKGLLYKAWIVTREIPQAISLSELSKADEEKARDVATAAAMQMRTLIENRLFHVDLHPGNVIVDANSKVYLMDFDKATYFKGKQKKLRDFYLCRWRRACIKHNLPDFLAEIVSLNLRKSFVENSSIEGVSA